MKFLQLRSKRRQVVVARPTVALVVVEGFGADVAVPVPVARVALALRDQLKVMPGGLLRVRGTQAVISCRVDVSSQGDGDDAVIRLNPRARERLGVAIGDTVAAEINHSPVSSAEVPLEVAPSMRGDEAIAEPMVRLPKAIRARLGLQPGNYVNIQRGEIRLPARVEVGADGDRAVARLNPMARGMLQTTIGDLVELVPFETLVLLIDASGSMDEILSRRKSKMAATREAILGLLESKERARERDVVGVVSFGEECDLVAPLGTDFKHLRQRVARLTPYGRTALFEGLSYTLEMLSAAHGLRRIILVSDGCPTTTGSDLVCTLAHKAKALGVAIDTIGVGGAARGPDVSYDEALLRQLADITGGQFTPVDAVRSLEDEFRCLSSAKKIPLLGAGDRI